MSNPFLKQVFNKDKTFRPKRKFEPGTQRFELHKKAQASLNAGLDLKLAVQLPSGEELNDWVAVHVVDFFNRVNLIYGTISDGCTEQSCPIMSGGPKYEYRWQDEHKFRKPTALSAPRYMDLLMDWIEVQINNEDIFPTNVDATWLPRQGSEATPPDSRLSGPSLCHIPGSGCTAAFLGSLSVPGHIFLPCLQTPGPQPVLTPSQANGIKCFARTAASLLLVCGTSENQSAGCSLGLDLWLSQERTGSTFHPHVPHLCH
ncbi:MOB kinase activator 3A isoform X1 [Myotis yumanensis]|uniref:MOB kinase activator 3A isoform X1 n=1 Tax=Myotis yumanensis TaxID=159337 RepID=UPI0038CFB8E3